MRVREALSRPRRQPDLGDHRAPALHHPDAPTRSSSCTRARCARSGTHQQLLAQRGIYWKLYQLQYKDQEVFGARSRPAISRPRPGTISRCGSCSPPERRAATAMARCCSRNCSTRKGDRLRPGRREDAGRGMRSDRQAHEVAAVGITEIIVHLPRIYASYRKLVRALRERRPDALVLIDFPDINFKLARHAHRLGIPVIFFVSPQIWAWKPWRMRLVAAVCGQDAGHLPFRRNILSRAQRRGGVRGASAGGHCAAAGIAGRIRANAQGSTQVAEWIALLPGQPPRRGAAEPAADARRQGASCRGCRASAMNTSCRSLRR